MAGLLLLASCSPARGARTDGSSEPPTSSLTPDQAASAFIAAHPKEWVIAIDDPDPEHAPKRPPWSAPCAAEPQNNSPYHFVALRYSGQEIELDLFFRCPLDGRSSLADIAAAFSHVSLDRLPHGIHVPDWKFQIMTPVSSFSEGVTFPVESDGRWGVDIATGLYAVRGDSTTAACHTPADGTSPRACYVHVEHRIPLRLTLRVPFDPGALDAGATAPGASASAGR